MKPDSPPADAPVTLPGAQRNAGAVPLDRYLLFGGLAMAGCALDLLTKELIFRWRGLPPPPGHENIWWLVKGYVGIETALNTGAVFGMGSGWSRYFAWLSIGAALGVVTWLFVLRAARDRLLTVALGCIMGGILGNLYDRLGMWLDGPLPAYMQNRGLEHAVRDWILFCWNFKQVTWPNFNIADSLLVCGAGLLVWHAFVLREPKGAVKSE